MVYRCLRQCRLSLVLAILGWIVVARAVELPAAAIQNQQPAQVQTAPIDEPRSAEKKSSAAPVAKGAEAITQEDAKCSKTLIVSADALFKPGRWTLNPGAAETLDVLGPMITKAGKYPLRIEAYIPSAGSASSDQIIAQRRAITVRGWLLNHRFVPEGTPVVGFAGNTAASIADDPNRTDKQKPDARVEIVIDTCH